MRRDVVKVALGVDRWPLYLMSSSQAGTESLVAGLWSSWFRELGAALGGARSAPGHGGGAETAAAAAPAAAARRTVHTLFGAARAAFFQDNLCARRAPPRRRAPPTRAPARR